MIKFFNILFICHFALGCFSQTTKSSLLSPYIKASTYSTEQTEVFSFHANQAALMQTKSFSAGVFSERKFMMSELNIFSAAIAMPTRSGNFGLQLHRFGNSVYSEMEAGLAYARKLSDYIDVGVQFNYFTMQIAGYGNTSTLNFDAGAIFHFTEKLNGGIHLSNPTSSKLGKSKEERLPAIYSAGLGYDASDHFFIGAEIEKEEDMPLNVIASIQYKMAERFLARGGVTTGTGVFFFGIGLTIKDFRLDATASVHQQLGVTPGLLLIYTKPSKD